MTNNRDIVAIFRCGSRSILATYREPMTKNSSSLFLVRNVIEISSISIPVQEKSVLGIGEDVNQKGLELKPLTSPNYLDGIPCAVPRMRIRVDSFYLVDWLPKTVKTQIISAYRTLVNLGLNWENEEEREKTAT